MGLTLNPSAPPVNQSMFTLGGLWSPPARLPLSEWAERNIVLSSEYARNASNLRLYPWQREIFDAFTDPRVEEITICSAVQLTKTLFIQAAMAYAVCEAPGPILIIQPKDDDAKAFSKERLNPMIRDCAELGKRISGSEKDGNTLLTKEFPGGLIALAGAISPGNFARRSVRYVFFDEPDKYPPSAGKEGDPIKLGIERTITFGNRRKIIQTCSPTISGHSRIMRAYEQSDQRKPWVACIKCGHYQLLDFRKRVKWTKKADSVEDRAATARYYCEGCNAALDSIDLGKCIKSVEWRALKPFRGHAGFWINHLYHPDKTLYQIVKDWLNAQSSRETLQTFINTTLAEVWTDEGSSPDHELLFNRREDYPFGAEAVVPTRGLFLTAAVDVQDNPPRLEVEVKAWGRGKECWSIDYQVIQLQTEDGELLPVTSQALWDKLETDVLKRQYRHATGHRMNILAMAVDTGKRPQPVYNFAAKHPKLLHGPTGMKLVSPMTVVPIKGNDDDLRIISAVSKEDAARKRQNVRIVHVGTHAVKQELFDALRYVQPNIDDKPVPGCFHHPLYEMSYFEGLCSETRVVTDKDKIEYRKKPGARNEPLDLAVYNRAMATIVGIERFTEEIWRGYEAQLGINAPKLREIVDSGPENGENTQKTAENGQETGENQLKTAGFTPSRAVQAPQNTLQQRSSVAPLRRRRGQFSINKPSF